MDNNSVISDNTVSSTPSNQVIFTDNNFQDNNISLQYFKTIPKVSSDVYLRLYTPLSAQNVINSLNLTNQYVSYSDLFVIVPHLMGELWNNIILVKHDKNKELFDMKKIVGIWISMFGAVSSEYEKNDKFENLKNEFILEIKQTFNTYNNLYYLNDIVNHFNHTFVGMLFLNIIKVLQPQLITVAVQLINQEKQKFDTQRLDFQQKWILAAQYLQQQINVLQMHQKQQYQEGEEGQEGYNNQFININNEKKENELDVECLNEGQPDEHYNSFDDILLQHSLLKYKQILSDNGLCSIDDFKLIGTRDELNQVVKDMHLPLLVQKKFVNLCLEYIQIDDYEGIEL